MKPNIVISKNSTIPFILSGTQKGITALYLSEDTDQLSSDFKKESQKWSAKNKTCIYRTIRALKTLIQDILDGSQEKSPPLDPQGTLFQKKVWTALSTIPKGKTLSYSDLAIKIKQPKAVRAVASACAKNNIAILIPCHRILRKTGDLGGYRWGSSIKKSLLAQEKN